MVLGFKLPGSLRRVSVSRSGEAICYVSVRRSAPSYDSRLFRYVSSADVRLARLLPYLRRRSWPARPTPETQKPKINVVPNTPPQLPLQHPT